MASTYPKLPGLVPTHDTWQKNHKKISHKKLDEIRNGKNVPVPLYDLPRAPTPIAQVTRGKTEENKSYSQTTYKNHFADNAEDIPEMFEPNFVKLDKQVRQSFLTFFLKL